MVPEPPGVLLVQRLLGIWNKVTEMRELNSTENAAVSAGIVPVAVAFGAFMTGYGVGAIAKKVYSKFFA